LENVDSDSVVVVPDRLKPERSLSLYSLTG